MTVVKSKTVYTIKYNEINENHGTRIIQFVPDLVLISILWLRVVYMVLFVGGWNEFLEGNLTNIKKNQHCLHITTNTRIWWSCCGYETIGVFHFQSVIVTLFQHLGEQVWILYNRPL